MVTDTDTTKIDPAHESVRVTLELSGRLVRDYDRLVEAGLYTPRDEALRQAVLTSWRFERGSFANLRLDIRAEDASNDPGAEPEGSDADAALK